MRPTRRTQPYRKGQRRRGGLADAMMRAGRPAGAPNPQDQQRQLAKKNARLRERLRALGR